MKVPQFVYLVDGEDSPRFTTDLREAMGSGRRILAKWFGGGDFQPYAKNPLDHGDDHPSGQKGVDEAVRASLLRLLHSGKLDEILRPFTR
jgi:hypothetical protein